VTRAAITGVGAVTPLGVGVDALYSGWTSGRSGIVDGQGACLDFEPTTELSRKEARRADRSPRPVGVARGPRRRCRTPRSGSAR
jgi:3-oxoacyl-[acyl-carrier-protein] synthase II